MYRYYYVTATLNFGLVKHAKCEGALNDQCEHFFSHKHKCFAHNIKSLTYQRQHYHITNALQRCNKLE